MLILSNAWSNTNVLALGKRRKKRGKREAVRQKNLKYWLLGLRRRSRGRQPKIEGFHYETNIALDMVLIKVSDQNSRTYFLSL